MVINSIYNKKVKEMVKLQDKKYRDKVNLFLIESEHLVLEALKKDLVKEIFLLENEENIYDREVTYVTYEVMKKITTQVTPSKVCAIVSKILEQEIKGNCLLLDGINDPGNLGTIIRSAVAFNMPNIILGLDCVDLYNAKVIRSCEGMIFHVNIVRKDLQEFIRNHANYKFYGTDVLNGIEVSSCDFKNNVGIVIGNEGHGISENIRKSLNEFIYIPMNNRCESLNAGISASIIMYELNRR